MGRKRLKLSVYVDLDPVPGAFYTPDSARNAVQLVLMRSMPHYNPTTILGNLVEVVEDDGKKGSP